MAPAYRRAVFSAIQDGASSIMQARDFTVTDNGDVIHNHDWSNLSTGAKVGIIVAAVVVCIAVVIGSFFAIKYFIGYANQGSRPPRQWGNPDMGQPGYGNMNNNSYYNNEIYPQAPTYPKPSPSTESPSYEAPPFTKEGGSKLVASSSGLECTKPLTRGQICSGGCS
jgi:hypothetical protein